MRRKRGSERGLKRKDNKIKSNHLEYFYVLISAGLMTLSVIRNWLSYPENVQRMGEMLKGYERSPLRFV